ncbi:hypothetical protein OC835_003434 [Tilletia horrida]|nr:hypothetical protein OC835_003434 [Tilletia horrida]
MMDVDPPPSPPRALEVSEILRDIFTYLAREQVDLVQLSTVNKQFRSVALPLLVRDLDVPLSRVRQFIQLFKAHPTLRNFVRSVRLHDQEAEIRHRARVHSMPRYLPEPQERESAWLHLEGDDSDEDRDDTDERWADATKLVQILWDDIAEYHPPFDLTFGISSSFPFNGLIEDTGLPITAFRVIADHDHSRLSSGAEDDYRAGCRSRWNQLGDTVKRKFMRRERRSLLKTLQIEDFHTPEESELNFLHTSTWNEIRDGCHHTIQKLALHADAVQLDTTILDRLLARDWKALRSLQISFQLEDEDTMMLDEEVDLNDFLARHTQLEEIWIDASAFFFPPALQMTFPGLTRFHVEGIVEEVLVPFLHRHSSTLIELALSGDFEPSRDFTNLRLPRLRILRASRRLVSGIIKKGCTPQLALVQLDPVNELQEIGRAFKAEPSSAARITGLDIEVEEEELHTALVDLGSALALHRLPSLAELSFCFTQSNSDEPIDSQRVSAKRIADLLRQLKDASSLRALRIEHSAAPVLSTKTPLQLPAAGVPPALEYFTWHAPDFNRTQYFRVIRLEVPANASARAYRRGPNATDPAARLQSLPPSFRVKIASNGEWLQPTELRHANILFDHTLCPPRLP